jgi:hypothetical protein
MNPRTTDQIVADVCAALSVERVEIRRPEHIVECVTCSEAFIDGRCPNACTDVGEDAQPTHQIVRTAGFAYYGNDRLDVSPGSADPIGGWFAPSREIAELMDCACRANNPALVAEAWTALERDYTAEMRVRFGVVPGSEHWGALSDDDRHEAYAALSRGVDPAPTAWDALLAMREVTLVCGCTETARCHRVLLARILEKLGARCLGEIR